jgi:hypothetical protein
MVYIGVYIKEWSCPKGGEIAIYRPVCGQCVARDKAYLQSLFRTVVGYRVIFLKRGTTRFQHWKSVINDRKHKEK